MENKYGVTYICVAGLHDSKEGIGNMLEFIEWNGAALTI